MGWDTGKLTDIFTVKQWGYFLQFVHNAPATVVRKRLSDGTAYDPRTEFPGAQGFIPYVISGIARIEEEHNPPYSYPSGKFRFIRGDSRHVWRGAPEADLALIALGVGETCNVKSIFASGELSLQNHAQRDERHIVVGGRGEYVFGKVEDAPEAPVVSDFRIEECGPGDEFIIPKGMLHQMRSRGGMTVIEITTGHFDEEDIRRFSPTGLDMYRRETEVARFADAPQEYLSRFPQPAMH